MTTHSRRYDIDWIRVIAIFFLLIYHIAIVFQPWGVFLAFVSSNEPIEGLWTAMAMLNVWRIPILFFVSGMGAYFALGKRSIIQLIMERTKRILLPFLFGVFTVVPLHFYVYQHYFDSDLNYVLSRGHLWFLLNIFVYVLVLSPVFYAIKNSTKLKQFLNRLFSNPLGLLVVMIFFVAETLLISPNPYEMYAMNFHGWVIGFLSFFFGFLFVYSGNQFWLHVKKGKWIYLGIAVSMYAIRVTIFDLQAPRYLMPIESIMWIVAVFGLAYSYLNKPSKTLSYLSESVYPVYIIHMVVMYVISALILPARLASFLEFVLIVISTFVVCYAIYHFVLRKVWFLRPLFGLKRIKKYNPLQFELYNNKAVFFQKRICK
jgi:glucan biosynthesis protein C